MNLQFGNIKLRALEPEDLEYLYQWENDSNLWYVGNTRSPYSRYMLKQYISQSDLNIYENKQLRLMIEKVDSSETIGTVDLFDFDIHNSRIALGLYIDKKYQGMGLATQALRAIENYVFSFLGIGQLYVHIASCNTASLAMFTKEIYERTATLKKWIKYEEAYIDIIVFQLFKEDYLRLKGTLH